jgi:ferredoxin--NADP+ reductase
MAIAEAHARAAAKGEIEKHLESNLEAMRLVAETPKDSNERELIFHFLAAPKEITGNGKVEEITFGINEVVNDAIVDSGKTFTIKADLVISAIGYESAPIDGVSFEKGKIANVDGRVLGSNIYAVGWAKRGPSGVIGTNKSDAADVVKLLIEDLTLPKSAGDITELLPTGHDVVTQEVWQRINSAEVAAGESQGRPRAKATSIAALLGLGKA